MADGGQNFFKVCMSVFMENNHDENNEISIKRRRTYAEAKKNGKKKSLTGVKKLIMICTWNKGNVRKFKDIIWFDQNKWYTF